MYSAAALSEAVITTSGTEGYLAAVEASILRRRRYAALRVLQCQHREVCRVEPVERPAL